MSRSSKNIANQIFGRETGITKKINIDQYDFNTNIENLQGIIEELIINKRNIDISYNNVEYSIKITEDSEYDGGIHKTGYLITVNISTSKLEIILSQFIPYENKNNYKTIAIRLKYKAEGLIKEYPKNLILDIWQKIHTYFIESNYKDLVNKNLLYNLEEYIIYEEHTIISPKSKPNYIQQTIRASSHESYEKYYKNPNIGGKKRSTKKNTNKTPILKK